MFNLIGNDTRQYFEPFNRVQKIENLSSFKNFINKMCLHIMYI